MEHKSRPYVLFEATYRQMLELRPNVAVLPWGATEAHNYHLPHGADTIEATSLGAEAVRLANEQGAKCVMLPAMPFGSNQTQLTQVATINVRSSTQQALLHDIAESLVHQGLDRLVLLNFHGGNEFKPMIRDVMLDLPIFIIQVNGWQTAPAMRNLLDHPDGDHGEEFETSYLMHIAPGWVASLDTAGDGSTTPSSLPALSSTPGVWAPRDWQALTESTGVGDPRAATAEKGRRIFEMLVDSLVPVLLELSQATNGDFPFVIRSKLDK